MLSEIGSVFWEYKINRDLSNDMFWWQSDLYQKKYFKSGRNAIKALGGHISGENRVVFLPSYTCETVIQPFLDEDWRVEYYKINRDMSIDTKYLSDMIEYEKPKIILVHGFFGFAVENSALELLKKCSEEGILIVEDLTQSLFSEHYIDFADYYVSSFRKFLAIPDGGVVISKRDISDMTSELCDKAIADTAFTAFEQKRAYFESYDAELKNSFREEYVKLNGLIGDNTALRDISEKSLSILLSCDKDEIISKRRNNYSYLLDGIRKIDFLTPAIGALTDGSAPLYLPVYAKERKELQAYLAANNVYCPVIWPRSQYVTADDEDISYMYGHMLCFPIDQRYGEDDMQRIVDLLKNFCV